MTYSIIEASGADLEIVQGPKAGCRRRLLGREDGFSEGNFPQRNTEIINKAIQGLSEEGGGILELPEGEYLVYTIVLKSGVYLRLTDETKILAAIPEIRDGWDKKSEDNFDYSYEKRDGEGGNYLEPEINPYVGNRCCSS